MSLFGFREAVHCLSLYLIALLDFQFSHNVDTDCVLLGQIAQPSRFSLARSSTMVVLCSFFRFFSLVIHQKESLGRFLKNERKPFF